MKPLIVLALLVATPAYAVEYESFVSVASEDELADLAAGEQLSPDDGEALAQLLRDGVDLAHADREELYELPNLSHADVDAILAHRQAHGLTSAADLTGVLSADKLRAILPFVRVPRGKTKLRGHLRAPLAYTPGDRLPAGALRARVDGGAWSAGAALVVTRLGVDEVVLDPSRDALSAAPAGTRVQLPRLFVAYQAGELGFVAGSYRAGFGERLTFDNTGRRSPHGFVVDEQIARGGARVRACHESAGELAGSPCDDREVSGDFAWREGLFGAAVSFDRRPLRFTAFVSLAARSPAQSELVDCDGEACVTPQVFQRGDQPLAPSSRVTGERLPDMFRESTAGAHVAVGGSRARLGVTAYASRVDWLVAGAELDFATSSRYPRGGGFGALGIDGVLGSGGTTLAGEATQSFTGEAAGRAAFLRAETRLGAHELELSTRWYGAGFDNPYARPVAAADEASGQRARDEAGVRLAYHARFAALALHGELDGHSDAQLAVSPDLAVSTGASLRLGSRAELGLHAGYASRVRGVLRGAWTASPAFRVEAQVSPTAGLLGAALRLGRALGLRVRSRWDDLQSAWSGFADLTFHTASGHGIRIRYDAVVSFDRATSGMGQPLEQWMWLELEQRF